MRNKHAARVTQGHTYGVLARSCVIHSALTSYVCPVVVWRRWVPECPGLSYVPPWLSGIPYACLLPVSGRKGLPVAMPVVGCTACECTAVRVVPPLRAAVPEAPASLSLLSPQLGRRVAMYW